MIHVDRGSVPVPESLRSPWAEQARREAAEYYGERTYAEKSQRRFEFDAKLWHVPDVVHAVRTLFNGKCAFCESPLEPGEPGVHHLRPVSNTKDPMSGRSHHDRYHWLAYEWENLYAACRGCARNHANQFPVRGPAAEPGTRGEALLDERPVLIDPCCDRPHDFLEFLPDGTVRERTVDDDGLRGGMTIRLLGLNREELVEARRDVATDTLRAIDAFWSQAPERLLLPDSLRSLLDPRHPHLSVRGAMIRHAASDETAPALVEALQQSGMDAAWMHRPAETAAPPSAPAAPRPRPVPLRVSAPPPGADPQPVSATPPPSTQAAYVERIEIRNYRAIRELVLELPRAAPAELQDATATGSDRPPMQPWLVLLGENGAGKSTVLQALAYALMGEAQARKTLKPASILRRTARGRQPAAGMVRVTLSTETIEFTFTRDRLDWKSGRDGAGVFVRGYGSTRLLPRPGEGRDDPRRTVIVDNLFDPFHPLHNAPHWLAELDSRAGKKRKRGGDDPAAHQAREKFDAAALAFKDLLRLADDQRLRHDRRRGVVLDDQDRVPIPLGRLSDGYQSVIALASDIMAGVPEAETDFATRAGIVLLDELGTHLHPRWRMEIVKGLRTAFPSLQFIATTHEPLCLRGLGKGEVVVMTREDGEVRALAGLPSPRELRSDQLLTSRYFGLHTTIDPDLDREFQEYYDLLARGGGATDPERARCQELKRSLHPHRVLGYTRRDQLVAEALDAFFARERTHPEPETLREETREEIIRIWERVSAGEGVP